MAQPASTLDELPSTAARQTEPPPLSLRALVPGSVRSGILAATLASNLLALALPLVLLQAYDRIIPNQATATLTALIVGLIVALLLDAAVRLARASLVAWAAARFESDTSCRLMQSMLAAPIDAFERSSFGRRLARFSAVDTLREFYGGQAAQNIVDLPFMIVFLMLIGLIGGALALIPIAVACLCAISIFMIGRRLNRALDNRSATDDRSYSLIVEILSGIENVKGLAIENLMLRRYERLLSQSATHSIDIAYLGAMAQSVGSIGANGAMIGLACVGAIDVIGGNLSLGALGACTLLAGRSVQPLVRVVAIWTQYQSIRLARERLTEAQALPCEDGSGVSPEVTPAVAKLRGDIELTDVTFAYAPDRRLLQALSLHIRPGDFVSITGSSGVGKSTLLHLMMGMHTPSVGRIDYDGRPLADVGAFAVRSNIAFLPQRPMLFRGTLRANLTQFSHGENERRALELAEQLGLHDVIARLPEGLETWIGDDMSSVLPAGVRQKIAIVRALTGDPPIILFDEANSNFDQEDDRRLGALLENLRGKRTIVLVSHRPSFQRMASRHFRLEDGRLVAAGREANGYSAR